MQYRREIDGLRAVAVASVILFHAGAGFVPGGFTGVDVFFVISGYLITSIILEERAAGHFSLMDFYERRVRRILPALYALCLLLIPFAIYWLLPNDLENFGQNLFATVFFSNNVLMWLKAGYFNTGNDFKPLLHTWSLGVEEQFYLFYPLLLLTIRKWTLRQIFVLLAALLVVSFIWSVTWFWFGPQGAFFLLPTRMWQLLAGSLLAISLAAWPSYLRLSRSMEQTAALGGLLLILLASAIPHGALPRPLASGLLPVAGAVLLILYARPENAAGAILGNRALVALGLISYSAYLWHQPLFAFARLAAFNQPPPAVMAGLTVLTLVLAWLSWRYIEAPFRDRSVTGRRTIALLSVATGLFLATTGLVFYFAAGLPARFNGLSPHLQVAGLRANAQFIGAPHKFAKRAFTTKDKTRVVVGGDSFARDFINAASANGYFNTAEVIYSPYMPSCISKRRPLKPVERRLIAAANVLILSATRVKADCWKQDRQHYRQAGAKKIIVIGMKNFGWNYNAIMHLDAPSRLASRARVLDRDWSYNERLKKAIGPEQFVDLLALIADARKRVPLFTPAGKLISFDQRHLTPDGARYLGKLLFEHPLLRDLK